MQLSKFVFLVVLAIYFHQPETAALRYINYGELPNVFCPTSSTTVTTIATTSLEESTETTSNTPSTTEVEFSTSTSEATFSPTTTDATSTISTPTTDTTDTSSSTMITTDATTTISSPSTGNPSSMTSSATVSTSSTFDNDQVVTTETTSGLNLTSTRVDPETSTKPLSSTEIPSTQKSSMSSQATESSTKISTTSLETDSTSTVHDSTLTTQTVRGESTSKSLETSERLLISTLPQTSQAETESIATDSTSTTSLNEMTSTTSNDSTITKSTISESSTTDDVDIFSSTSSTTEASGETTTETEDSSSFHYSSSESSSTIGSSPTEAIESTGEETTSPASATSEAVSTNEIRMVNTTSTIEKSTSVTSSAEQSEPTTSVATTDSDVLTRIEMTTNVETKEATGSTTTNEETTARGVETSKISAKSTPASEATITSIPISSTTIDSGISTKSETTVGAEELSTGKTEEITTSGNVVTESSSRMSTNGIEESTTQDSYETTERSESKSTVEIGKLPSSTTDAVTESSRRMSTNGIGESTTQDSYETTERSESKSTVEIGKLPSSTTDAVAESSSGMSTNGIGESTTQDSYETTERSESRSTANVEKLTTTGVDAEKESSSTMNREQIEESTTPKTTTEDIEDRSSEGKSTKETTTKDYEESVSSTKSTSTSEITSSITPTIESPTDSDLFSTTNPYGRTSRITWPRSTSSKSEAEKTTEHEMSRKTTNSVIRSETTITRTRMDNPTIGPQFEQTTTYFMADGTRKTETKMTTPTQLMTELKTRVTPSGASEATTSSPSSTTPTNVCPDGMIEGRLFCYGFVNTFHTYSYNFGTCKQNFGAKSNLVPKYAMYDPIDRVLLMNMTRLYMNNTILFADSEGGPKHRQNKKVEIVDLSKFPTNPKTKVVGFGETIDEITPICRVPKYGKNVQCSTGSMYTIEDLGELVKIPPKNNTLYEIGETLRLTCKKSDCEKQNWDLKCANSGWWVPSPETITCVRKRGAAFVPENPVGVYRELVEDCSMCSWYGTKKCTEVGINNATSVREYKCECKEKFNGYWCEVKGEWCGIDDKANDYCSNNGKCVNELENAVCECDYGMGSEKCEFNRTTFGWNIYGWLSGASISINVFWILLVLWLIVASLTLTEIKENDDRFSTIIRCRHWTVLFYALAFAIGRKPQILGLVSSGCDFYFFLIHGAALMATAFHASEIVAYQGTVLCRQRNGWSSWDDFMLTDSSSRNILCFLGIPIYGAVIIAFTVYAISISSNPLGVTTTWSCLGQLHQVNTTAAFVMLLFNFCIVLVGVVFIWVVHRFADQNEIHRWKRQAWWQHYAPTKIELTAKVTRQRRFVQLLPVLFFFQYLFGVLSTSYPEVQWFDRAFAGFMWSYIALFLLQIVYLNARSWSKLCNFMMKYFPKCMSPNFNTVTLYSRDETLQWLRPNRYRREKENEFEKKRKTAVKERMKLIERRERMMKNFPLLPNRLLPHIPDEQPIEMDDEYEFDPRGCKDSKEFLPKYLRDVLRLTIIRHYCTMRLKKRSRMSKIDCAVHVGVKEYQHFKDTWISKKRDAPALAQLGILVAHTISDIVSDDWICYRREKPEEHSKLDDLRKDNPGLYHYLKDQRMRPWWPYKKTSDDYADDAYRAILTTTTYRQTKGNTPAVYYKNRIQEYISFVFQPLPLYVVRFPYIRTLAIWEARQKMQIEQDEEDNEPWKRIYETDPWFAALSDYEKKAIRSEFKVYKSTRGTSNFNPRELGFDNMLSAFWEYRKLGFIGPREKSVMVTPEFNHPLCSNRKRFAEEVDSYQIRQYYYCQHIGLDELYDPDMDYQSEENWHSLEMQHVANPTEFGINDIPQATREKLRKRRFAKNKYF
ncbi:unnamed protein product [Caenorhabditis bovis]|uniref:EGF-like domain-containing protein n=1 Tax=Caenorhabditis bovis TaxID=2654633 RepID=A0A8S1F2Q5_9PELO|nr:unnamed protein product [Caenorhabditis bovis]